MVNAKLEEYAPQLGLKGYDVWGYDELCRFIDDNQEIRRTYAGYITSGDVLSKMMEYLDDAQPNFNEIFGAFLQKQLTHDQAARLESAGQDFEQQIPLSRVFVDLPATKHAERANISMDMPMARGMDSNGLVETLLDSGAVILRNANVAREKNNTDGTLQKDSISPFTVIVGGPGQGKSTIGQYLCQLYRSALLKPLQQQNRLDTTVQKIINVIEEQRKVEKPPSVRRFPIRIILNQYATDLAKDKTLTVLEYIRREITQFGGAGCSLKNVKDWLKAYPWLVIFDGLDEVPSSSNRSQVLKEIENFRIDAANLNADIQIIATTRPQNYSNEFSANLYEHWYLTPLSPKQALNYAKKLVGFRCGTNGARKDLVFRRLDTACQTEVTARLMQSPLQVTIMATLVEKVGEPPRQRYSLFEQYYRAIYDRETGREGSMSSLLSIRKTDINAIHYRTGLLLQTESETEGRTEARLSDERFRALVQARLDEMGCTGDEAQKLLTQITDGSLQRLVFLVRPEAGQVAFEIRSLQEFMAAEALLNGSEASVIARLKAIAPIAHWRNVFLFAVGKCFSQKEYLLDHVFSVCEELNDRGTDPAAEATLWGSRLALDILAEGISDQNLKRKRQLLRVALKLVAIPDIAINVRLADLYDIRFEDLFKEAIRDRLGQAYVDKQHGARAVLQKLADRKIDWAFKLIDETWPTDKDTQKKLVFFEPSLYSRAYMANKIMNLIPDLIPFELEGLDWVEICSNSTVNQPLPAWFCTIHNIADSNFTRKNRTKVELHDKNSTKILTANIVSVTDKSISKLIPLKDIPLVNSTWCPYISAGRFAQNPDSSTLSNELRWLAETWDLDTNRLLQYTNFAWPLASCLSGVYSKDELLQYAERAEKGEFGSLRDWQKAEERWANTKILMMDELEYLDDSRWPYDQNIGQHGFPFSCSFLSFEMNGVRILSNSLIDKYEHIKEGKAKFWAVHCLINSLSTSFFKQQTQSVEISPEKLKQIFELGWKWYKGLNFDLLQSLSIPKNLTKEWIEFFVWLGKEEDLRHGLNNKPWKYADQIANWFTTQPEKFSGLLRILGGLAFSGSQFTVPKDILTETIFKQSDAFDIALLRLSHTDCQVDEIDELARDFICLYQQKKTTNAISLALQMLTRPLFPPERRELFALSLWKELSLLENDYSIPLREVLEILATKMNRQKSNLSEANIWNELALPKMKAS